MSRFNQVIDTSTENLAGGQGYSESTELEFISLISTSFLKDKFYESSSNQLKRLVSLISKLDKKFVAKTALYARNELGMRSVTHVMAGEIAKSVKGQEWTKSFFQKIVRRPDDMFEILAYLHADKKFEPNAIKKGFAKALEGMNDYTLGKYKGSGKEVSLFDVVNLCHPKYTASLTKLMKGTLQPPETWEVEISRAGRDEQLKKSAWRRLVLEKKLGYMALLRNLRNLIENVPELHQEISEQLTNREAIKKSLVLPFRFTTAYEVLEEFDAREIKSALSKAVDIALDNVPDFDGKTAIVIDGSGSMSGDPIAKASLFGASLYKKNNSDIIMFDNDAQYYNPHFEDSLFSIADRIKSRANGGGTNFNAPFEIMNKVYDRIIILSDMQGWVGYYSPKQAFNNYKKLTGANPKVYSFDLTGYGTLEFPENSVYCLAGFSDKVFNLMKLLETDRKAIVSTINKIEI